MKQHHKLLVGILAVLLGVVICVANAQTKIPTPTGYVNDLAGILKPSTRIELERRLDQYKRQTSIEIAILTVKELEGTTIEEYANKVFNTWGIGQKGLDNGLLFVQSLNPRKFRSEVGYGLEGYLPDATMQSIQRNEVVPYLKQGDWDQAYISAINAVTKELGEMSLTERQRALEEKKKQDAIASAKMQEGLVSFGLWALLFLAIAGVVFGAYKLVQKIQREAANRIAYEKELNDRATISIENLQRAKVANIAGVDDAIRSIESLLFDFLAKVKKVEELNPAGYQTSIDFITKPIATKYSQYEKVRKLLSEATNRMSKCESVLSKAKLSYTKLSAYSGGVDDLSARANKVQTMGLENLQLALTDIKHLFGKFEYMKAELACASFDRSEDAFLSTCNEVVGKLGSMEFAKKSAREDYNRAVGIFTKNRDVIKSYGGDVTKIQSKIEGLKKKIDAFDEFGNWFIITALIAELTNLISAPINKKLAEKEAAREKERRRLQAFEDERRRVRDAVAADAAAAASRRRSEESSRSSYSGGGSGGGFSGGGSGGGGATSDY